MKTSYMQYMRIHLYPLAYYSGYIIQSPKKYRLSFIFHFNSAVKVEVVYIYTLTHTHRETDAVKISRH